MSNKECNSLDDFERFVKNTITPWSPEQRIALAASMAERWLPVYQSFSEDEEWGDPAIFERALQSVWKCALGDELTPKPGWDPDTRFWIEMPYKNPDIGFDVNSPEGPHSYGPSLRRLWIEAKQSGDSDIWNSVLQWARHQPAAWDEKKKQAAYAPELSERLTRELSWRATDDVDHPWTTKVAGETWRVRLNDFPDDVMYTLLIDDAIIGKFHDWPDAWQR